MGGLIGGACGAIGVYLPEIVGGGYSVIHQMVAGQFTITLFIFFALRF